MKDEKLMLQQEIKILKAFKSIKSICESYGPYHEEPEDKYYEIKDIVERVLKEEKI